MEKYIVNIADLKVARDPAVITTLGLGSCVGVTIYDPRTRIGGLVHVMLPVSNSDKSNKAKYADTGIPELLRQMLSMGASRSSLTAKITGGANMFSKSVRSDVLMIGEKNIYMCRTALQQNRIHIASEDTGGNYGRTIELYTDSGKLLIKTIGHGEKYI